MLVQYRVIGSYLVYCLLVGDIIHYAHHIGLCGLKNEQLRRRIQ